MSALTSARISCTGVPLTPDVFVYLGLGSNLGDRRENLRRGLDFLAQRLTITAVSSLYETDPVDYVDQPAYLNAVCQAMTSAAPQQVFAWAKEAESALGRIPTVRFGPRTLDVDILLYRDLVCETPELVVPHPRMAARAFVLVPLAEIAPAVKHPVSGKTAAALLRAVGDQQGVRLYQGIDWWREG